jgi:hypothetical protein
MLQLATEAPYIDAIWVPRGCQMNLKPEIKLQQDLNHYSFGGPP